LRSAFLFRNPKSAIRNKMKSYLKIVLAMFIWSTWGLLIRWMALPPVVVLFYTSLIAGIVVPVVLKVRGDFPTSVLNLDYWYLYAGLAFTSMLNNLTYFYALGHTTVSNAIFTHYTAPVIVAALAPFMIKERLQRVTLISLPIAAAGMTMIVLANGGISLNSAQLPGILAGTASGVGYAFVIIFSRKLSQLLLHQKAIIVLLWITIIATAPAALSVEYTVDLRTGILLLITGILHSTAAPLMYFSALRKVLAQHAAILGYIEPLAAIPLAFLFLAETPPPVALLGGILILFSGVLVMRQRGEQRG
jgi:drug/metabolite transporter (DMT)-like permease